MSDTQQMPPATPHTASSEALLDLILKRIPALPELAMRTGRLSTILVESDPQDTIVALDHLIRRTLAGDETTAVAVLALATLLIEASVRRHEHAERFYDVVRDLYQAAAQTEGCQHVAYILLELPAKRTLLNRRALVQPRFDREVSLGERKQMAASNNRQNLERLLVDLDPAVVRRVCGNPRISQTDIMRICTRRPNIPEALMEVALSHRWVVRYEIRHALLRNPYAPTGLGLKFLLLLHRQDLRRVSQAGDLHPAIAQMAERILDLRPVA